MSDPQTETSAGDAREERIGRILNDYLDRRARGEAESLDELLGRHADLAGELREHLDLLYDLRPVTTKIDALINQGVLTRSDDPRYIAELGPYQIVSYLGRGGMGIVLKAYDASLDRHVAIKLLRPELADDPAAIRRFEREARAAAALQNAHIVTVHAVGEHNGTHYIVMEYVAGPSLAGLIREHGPLPTDVTREIFGQLLDGLAAAHAAGLIHRDIKPSNILLDCGLRVEDCGLSPAEAEAAPPMADRQSSIVNRQCPIAKLADFGLARMRTAQTTLTQTDSVLGTPDYMSPEQARGEAEIDQRSDLYSAGVVLYEMLTGRTPFKADSPSAVIHRILNEAPEHPRKLSGDADPVLAGLALRLMEKQREDRLEGVAEVLKAMTSDKRPSSPTARRRLRRHSVTALAILTVIVAASWLAGRSLLRLREMVAVQVPMDSPTTVCVQYAGPTDWEELHRFPDTVRQILAAKIADLDGAGRQAVVVGLDHPFERCSLFAFDARGRELWRTPLDGRMPWPDSSGTGPWPCSPVFAYDLDGEPGGELIAVASDNDMYPTRLSIVDSREGTIRSTFWHYGGLGKVWVFPDMLGPGSPAIVAIGRNNKLDGFGEEPLPPRPYVQQPQEDKPRTEHDVVAVAMILDPRDLDGIGPPRSPFLPDIPAARPVAYAFLDIPASEAAARTKPVQTPVGGIQTVILLPPEKRGDEPMLQLQISRQTGGRGAFLTLDRNLNVHDVELATGEREPEEFWKSHWQPIIQDGRYLKGDDPE